MTLELVLVMLEMECCLLVKDVDTKVEEEGVEGVKEGTEEVTSTQE